MTTRGSDGFFSIDADWRYTYVSEEGARLAGRSADELIGEFVWGAFPELEGTAFCDVLRTAMETREAGQLEAYYPAHDSWYDMRVYPTEHGLSIYFRDVTERKERTQQFEAIFNNTYTFVGLAEPDGTLIKANDTALEFGQLDREDVIGAPLWETFWFQANRETGKTAREAVKRARGGEPFQDEIRVQGADRDAVIDFTIRPITNDAGEVTHLIPEGRDVTERERVSQELRRERDFIEKALDTLEDIFYVVGTGGEIRRWNERVPAITGYSNDEIADMQALEFFPEDEHDRVSTAIDETLTSGRAVVEADLLTKAGERIAYELTGARLTDTEGTLIGLVGIGRDITAKNAREQKLQNQREHLDALNSLNSVARDITDAVIEQSTKAEIERITCEKLANSESYACAWIASEDPPSGELRSHLEIDSDSCHGSDVSSIQHLQPLWQGPATETFETGELVVSQDVLGETAFEPWHEPAENCGFRSFISVPIAHEETQFGVLGIHSPRPDAFEQEEQEIIEQLGEVIGYVFYALERKEMLGSALELEFRSDLLADLFLDENHDDVEMTLEGAVPLDGGGSTFVEFWKTSEECLEAFQNAVDRHDSTVSARLLSTVEGAARFEVTGTSTSISGAFSAQGGTIKSASLTDQSIRMVSEFPETADLEVVTRGLRETIPDIELVSQKRILTPQYLRQMVDENLTDRQRTVLQMAYFGEYFAHPRQSTGENLADHLGITKQTFHHHLRKAEATVFELLFEDPADPLI